MTDNVRFLRNADPLPERIRVHLNAIDRHEMGRQDWIEGILGLAEDLKEAKGRYPETKQFRTWLNDCDLEHEKLLKNERAILIRWADDLPFWRHKLEGTDRTSIQMIDLEFKDALRVPSARNSEPTGTCEANTPETPANLPQNVYAAPTENAIPDYQEGAPKGLVAFEQETVSLKMLQLSPLGKLPDAETVLGFILSKPTRTKIASIVDGRKNHPLWLLICDAIKTGAFGEPSNAHVSKPNLRLVLPWVGFAFSQRFDLTNKCDIDRARKEVLPVVLAHRAALMKEPERLPDLMRDAAYAKRKEIEQTIVETAVQKMPATEKEVMAFGTRIWPRISDQGFTYDELCYAVWFFQWMVDQLRADWSAASKAIQLRHTVKHLRPMLKGNCASAILEICTAYGANPEGECQWPPRPINYGIS